MTLQDVRRQLFRSRTRWVVTAAVFAGALTWLLTSNFYDGLTMGMVVFTCSGLNLDNVVFMVPFIQKLPRWGQITFLSAGLVLSVAGVEVILPLWIVSAINHTGFAETFRMAAFHPKQYLVLQEKSAQFIDAGAYTFLALLSLTNIMSPAPRVKWWDWAETRLSQWGEQTLMAFAIVGVTLIALAWMAPTSNRTLLLLVILTVYVTFFIFKIVEATIEKKSQAEGSVRRSKGAAMMLLAFITLLESVFNIDALAGAYAITDNFKVVVIGLAVSALVMRAMMFDGAKHDITGQFKYIVIAANWAILWLALMMLLLSFGVPVPDMMVGVGGTAIILAGGLHSHLERRADERRRRQRQPEGAAV